MATYAEAQDFIDAFGITEMVQLTNLDDAGATQINLSRLQQNQEKAFARINAAIANCPTIAALMPFSIPVPMLKDYELDITRYFLDHNLAREDVRQRYEDAIADLKAIGKCEMGIGLDGQIPAEVISVNKTRAVAFCPTKPVFTQEFLRGF